MLKHLTQDSAGCQSWPLLTIILQHFSCCYLSSVSILFGSVLPVWIHSIFIFQGISALCTVQEISGTSNVCSERQNTGCIASQQERFLPLFLAQHLHPLALHSLTSQTGLQLEWQLFQFNQCIQYNAMLVPNNVLQCVIPCTFFGSVTAALKRFSEVE